MIHTAIQQIINLVTVNRKRSYHQRKTLIPSTVNGHTINEKPSYPQP
jgi:hypothetical protein